MENNKNQQQEVTEEQINELLKMLDSFGNSETGRLKVQYTEELEAGEVKKAHHLGRCDIGSPWADGSVGNCD